MTDLFTLWNFIFTLWVSFYLSFKCFCGKDHSDEEQRLLCDSLGLNTGSAFASLVKLTYLCLTFLYKMGLLIAPSLWWVVNFHQINIKHIEWCLGHNKHSISYSSQYYVINILFLFNSPPPPSPGFYAQKVYIYS